MLIKFPFLYNYFPMEPCPVNKQYRCAFRRFFGLRNESQYADTFRKQKTPKISNDTNMIPNTEKGQTCKTVWHYTLNFKKSSVRIFPPNLSECLRSNSAFVVIQSSFSISSYFPALFIEVLTV
jgi:hypothetical protein